MPLISEIKTLVTFGRRLYERQFVAGTDGNLSLRLSDGTILITPSGAAKGFLQESDMILVDSEGRKISGEKDPSSELLMHLHVYKRRPEIGACCHAHPPYATAFSVVERLLPMNILPEVILGVGEIALTEYAPPGTEAVPEALEKHLADHNAFILGNHGVLTIGKDMEQAYNRMETVEHYAQIIYIAEKTGKLNFLALDEVRRLEKIRDTRERGEKS